MVLLHITNLYYRRMIATYYISVKDTIETFIFKHISNKSEIFKLSFKTSISKDYLVRKIKYSIKNY